MSLNLEILPCFSGSHTKGADSPDAERDSIPSVVERLGDQADAEKASSSQAASSSFQGGQDCGLPGAVPVAEEEAEPARCNTEPVQGLSGLEMSPDGPEMAPKVSRSLQAPPMRHAKSGSGLPGRSREMPMKQTRSSFARPSEARPGFARSLLEMVRESDVDKPAGKQSTFSTPPGGAQHGQSRSFLAVPGGAVEVPRPNDQVSRVTSNRSNLGGSFLHMAAVPTRGLIKSAGRPQASEPQQEEHSSRSARPLSLWNAAPTVTHALVLAAAGISSFLTLTEADMASPTWAALLAVYLLGLLVLMCIACVQACHLEAFAKVPPLLSAIFHLALLGLEGHRGTATRQAWADATLRVTVLQLLAMGLHSASRPAWLATWSLFAPGTALVVALAGSLVPSELVQVLLLPFAATLGLALMAGRDLEGGVSCRQGFLEALLGTPCKWESFSTAFPAVDPRLPITKLMLQERLGATIANLEAALLPPALRHAICLLMKTVRVQVDALHGESVALREMVKLDEATPAVQEYVMGLIESQTYELGTQAAAMTPETSQLCGQLSFVDQVQGLVQPLLAREATEVAKPSASPQVIKEATRRLGLWDFDLSALGVLCNGKPLIIVGQAAFRPLLVQLDVEMKKAQSFLSSLEAHYFSSNPYHNATHAADVLNSMAHFQNLKSGPMASLRPLERLAGCLAAAAHDVGHDGFNNRFHSGAETPLGRLFNDQSCLENLHSAITFALLNSSGTDFLATIPRADWAVLRQMVVQMILDTDMGKHFQAVAAFKKEFLEPEQKEAEDSAKRRQLLLSFVLKACDIGASAKPFTIHAVWASRITAEFFRQGDEERRLGLSISPLCDRNTKNIGESQVGFYEFIVLPLYQALNDHLQSCRVKEEMIAQAGQNRDFWKRYDSSKFDYDSPESSAPALIQLFGDPADHLVVPFVQGSSSSS